MKHFFWLLLWSWSLPAADLATVVQSALEHHPEYAQHQRWQQLGQAYQQQGNHLLGGDPSLNFGFAGDQWGSDFGYEEYTAGINLPIAMPGQRQAKQVLGQTLSERAQIELKALRWRVSGEVIDLAWQLKISQVELKQALKRWAAARALEKDIRHRFEAGELSRNDLLMAQQEVIDAETAYQQAVNAHQQAHLAWFNYTRINDLPDDLADFQAQNKTIDGQHPQLQWAQLKSQSAEAQLELTRQQRRAPPEIHLYAKRDRGDRAEDYTDSIGIELSIPLGSRTAHAVELAQSALDWGTAQSELAQVQRQLKLQIEQAEQEVAKAEHVWQLAQKKYHYAHARLKLAKKAFELGEMDLYQLLLARQQEAEAAKELQIRRLEKQYQLARQAHLLGNLP